MRSVESWPQFWKKWTSVSLERFNFDFFEICSAHLHTPVYAKPSHGFMLFQYFLHRNGVLSVSKLRTDCTADAASETHHWWRQG